jgi:hypothetical protein
MQVLFPNFYFAGLSAAAVEPDDRSIQSKFFRRLVFVALFFGFCFV